MSDDVTKDNGTNESATKDNATKDNAKTDNDATTAQRRIPPLAGAIGLLLAGGLAGGILAATNSASATDGTSAISVAATPTPSADRRDGGREGETALTGANLATARAAALKAVPGATVDRIETDADGAVYEAHMTKADGTRVTVKFDKDFKVTSTEDGRGGGGRGGHAGRDGKTSSSSSSSSGTSI
jgi:uncharacterized membrane protein YkoI